MPGGTGALGVAAPALGGNETKLGLAGGGTPAAVAVKAVMPPVRRAWRAAPASWAAAPASLAAGHVTGRRQRLADGRATGRGGGDGGVELRDNADLHAWKAANQTQRALSPELPAPASVPSSQVSSQLGAATSAVKSAKAVRDGMNLCVGCE